eukprot:Seg2308.3 transcript_id=Seg2308.3/GoldUCD/mRNA.D3Y31 product="hypothetical protein" protein_id=Seg2308.3/GoldUCD/D3Y31
MKLLCRGFLFVFALSMLARNCINAIDVELIWWDSPPYIYRNSTGEITGLVKSAFEGVSQHECDSDSISYGRRFDGYDEFMDHVNKLHVDSNANSTAFKLYFPAYHDSCLDKRYLMEEVGFANSPGMTMVSNSFLSSNLYRLAVNGFNNTKVLLVMISVIMINFGMIMWMAVSIPVLGFL